jgi:ribosomal protein S6--L-glutamate ligase
MSKELVILSGRPDLYSTRRLLEEAKLAAWQAEVVDYRRCALGISTETTSQVLYHSRPLRPSVIVPRIGSRSSRFGAAVVRQFVGMGVRTTVTPGGILRARDKLATLQALGAAGVPVPLTSAARTPSGLAEVLGLVGGTPVVVKLVEGTHGSGVVLAETRKAAESLVAAFHQLDADFCVQAFVKEAQGEDLRAFVVDGRVVAAMRRKAAAGEFRANLHQGGEAFPVELDRLEEEVAIAAAACVGVDVAGVDLLRTENGPLVLEVNVSPGLQGIERASGVNVAAEVIEYSRRLCRALGPGVDLSAIATDELV